MKYNSRHSHLLIKTCVRVLVWLTLIAPATLSCGLVAMMATPTPTFTSTPTSTITPTATSTQSPTATELPTQAPTQTASPTPGPDHVIVYVYARDGSLESQLADHGNMAETLGLNPFVEWYATWCGPCNRLASYIEEGNPYIMDALAGTYIIKLDCDDEWDWWRAEELGYVFDFIPIFFEMNSDGTSSGSWIDGDDFMAENVEDIGAALKAFFDASR